MTTDKLTESRIVEDPILAASRTRRAEQAEANMESVRAAQARLAPLLAEGHAAEAIKEAWTRAHGATFRARAVELESVRQDGSKLALAAHSAIGAFAVFQQHLNNIRNVATADAIIAGLRPEDFPPGPDAGFRANRSGAAKAMLLRAIASGAVLEDAWRGLHEYWTTRYATATGAPVTPRPEQKDPPGASPRQTHAISSTRLPADEED